MLKIRLAVYKDADTLLKWKNDPEVRKNSIISHDIIKRKNHLKWLKDRLTDPNTRLYIIYNSKNEFGDIRFDIGKEIEVSIRIDKHYRNMGIATEVVGWASKLIQNKFKKTLMAKVVDGNIPSMKVFLKNGFKYRLHKDGITYLERI